MAADVAASTARAGHALARHAQLLSRAACSGGTAAAVAAAAAAAELSACDQTSMERSMDASSDASNHAPFLRGSMHTSLRRPQMIARTFGAVRRVCPEVSWIVVGREQGRGSSIYITSCRGRHERNHAEAQKGQQGEGYHGRLVCSQVAHLSKMMRRVDKRLGGQAVADLKGDNQTLSAWVCERKA